jgi:hypothetical protein
MFLSCHQNVGENYDLKTADTSFENVAQLKYLRLTVTNQNSIQGEIMKRLIPGNVCYHSVQNVLPFQNYYLASGSKWGMLG